MGYLWQALYRGVSRNGSNGGRTVLTFLYARRHCAGMRSCIFGFILDNRTQGEVDPNRYGVVRFRSITMAPLRDS